jgi:hypothetical protein
VSFRPVTFPRESCRIELHNVVVDGGAGCDELSPHGHEEPVEGVDWLLALDLDLAAVESSTELHLLIPMKPHRQSLQHLMSALVHLWNLVGRDIETLEEISR